MLVSYFWLPNSSNESCSDEIENVFRNVFAYLRQNCREQTGMQSWLMLFLKLSSHIQAHFSYFQSRLYREGLITRLKSRVIGISMEKVNHRMYSKFLSLIIWTISQCSRLSYRCSATFIDFLNFFQRLGSYIKV